MKIHGKLHIPKVPGPFAPETILIIIFLDLIVWSIIWENWICLFIIENAKQIAYPKEPGILGPPNNINHYILGFGGLDYHLGELSLFVYQ